MIWHSEQPGSPSINSAIYYKGSEKSGRPQLFFQDALLNCYTSEMEKYCVENNIPFQILLFVGNAPGHPPFIGDRHPNNKVVFLPPVTTSLIQPMGHGVITACKASCLWNAFAQAVAASEEDTDPILEGL